MSVTNNRFLNQKPIFINGFSRGGSNLLVNMLISHPEVCISNGETHKVFKGTARADNKFKTIFKKLTRDYPIRILTGQDVFRTDLLEPRKPLPSYLQNYIDQILYRGRFNCRIPTHNLYKSENVEYRDEELAKCRLLSKGLNGLAYTASIFYQMYPDACHFALVRNGLAICEGKIRRGHRDISLLANEYNQVVEEMLRNQEKFPNYHVVKYEEMVSQPQQFLKQLYIKANLDIEKLTSVRLESKPIMDKSGVHKLKKGYDHQLFWYHLDDLHNHIRTDINKNQINMLDPVHRKKFLAIAGGTLKKLGYEY